VAAGVGHPLADFSYHFWHKPPDKLKHKEMGQGGITEQESVSYEHNISPEDRAAAIEHIKKYKEE